MTNKYISLKLQHIIGLTIFIAGMFGVTQNGHSQNDFKIVDVKFDSNLCRVALYVKAVKNNASHKFSRTDEFVVKEYIRGVKNEAPYDSVAYQIVLDKSRRQNLNAVKILFVVDQHNSTGTYSSLIQSVMTSLGDVSTGVQYYLLPYGDKVSNPIAFSAPTAVETYLSGTDSFSDLHGALVKAAQFAAVSREKCAIFLFSSGQNNYNPANYINRAPYSSSDVLEFYAKLNSNTGIYTVGVGNNIQDSLLIALPKITANKTDTFTIASIPSNINTQLGQNDEILYNNIFYIKTANPVYRTEPRAYEAQWIAGPRDHKNTRKEFNFGSFSSPFTLCGQESNFDWLIRWLLGLGIVGGLLGIFAIAIPTLDKRNFYKKYVVSYKKQAGITHIDPITQDPITEGESVVIKCNRQICTVSTWEFVKNQCPNYPRCLDFNPPCDGAGAPSDRDKFFSGKGGFRRLNWLWFGMVGGLIGWSIFALFKVFGLSWYNNLIFKLLRGLNSIQQENNISTLADDTILGITFGAGVCFTLSWVEERSQPRKISWLRIAMRTVFGILISFLIFFAGFYLRSQAIVSNEILAAFITWFVFGLGIGIVLSLESSISIWRGMLGGIIAAVLAFLILLLFNTNFGIAKLISLVLMGGALGFTLVTVITRLEDFELEYISPEAYRQTNPISKWLKNGMDIFIGREPGNYVYVKWEDAAVAPFHARLFYDRGIVYIEPLSETMINGKLIPLKTNTPLQNGDLIQLGRNSISRMRYKEKRNANTLNSTRKK
ncbi:MAG: FHA domain-containing protein [Chitinophagales bacterium]|nr:FHA domain-containing protein [Chitinophagales bacterium]